MIYHLYEAAIISLTRFQAEEEASPPHYNPRIGVACSVDQDGSSPGWDDTVSHVTLDGTGRSSKSYPERGREIDYILVGASCPGVDALDLRISTHFILGTARTCYIASF